MVLEQFTEKLDETAKARQEARDILSKLEYFGKLHLTGVLVCRHGKVSPYKHKAAEHKYGSERIKVIENVSSIRDAFEDFEEKGKIKICFENELVYKGDIQRKK